MPYNDFIQLVVELIYNLETYLFYGCQNTVYPLIDTIITESYGFWNTIIIKITQYLSMFIIYGYLVY